jgi:hypothetical protein
MHALQFVGLALASSSCLAGPISTQWDTASLSVQDLSAREWGKQQCHLATLGMSTWQLGALEVCDATHAVFTGVGQDTAASPLNLQMAATPEVEQPVHGMTVVADRRRPNAPLVQRREPGPLPALAAR